MRITLYTLAFVVLILALFSISGANSLSDGIFGTLAGCTVGMCLKGIHPK